MEKQKFETISVLVGSAKRMTTDELKRIVVSAKRLGWARLTFFFP